MSAWGLSAKCFLTKEHFGFRPQRVFHCLVLSVPAIRWVHLPCSHRYFRDLVQKSQWREIRSWYCIAPHPRGKENMPPKRWTLNKPERSNQGCNKGVTYCNCSSSPGSPSLCLACQSSDTTVCDRTVSSPLYPLLPCNHNFVCVVRGSNSSHS